MATKGTQNSTQRFGIVVLSGVGIFLFYHSYCATGTVMEVRSQVVTVTAAPVDARLGDLRSLEIRDSLLAEALPATRDPFKNAPPPLSGRTTPATATATAYRPVPILRALLFDTVNPSVQLSLGERTSEWLHKGDGFRGWTVTEITPTSVELSCQGKRIVLSSSS